MKAKQREQTMKCGVLSKAGNWIIYAGLLVAGTGPVMAQDSSEADAWKYKAAIYLWGSGVSGTTAVGDDIDVGFSDILDNLDFAFMGAFEARKSKWSMAADVIYLNISASDAGTFGPLGGSASADVDMESWVLTLLGARNVYEEDNLSIDMLAGARYVDVESELALSLPGPLPPTSLKSSDSVWDGIIGVKGQYKLSEKWFLPYYLDVGTGQSDFTWQAYGGVGYSFDRVDVILAYRYLDYEFDSDSAIKSISFSGPLLGAAFNF